MEQEELLPHQVEQEEFPLHQAEQEEEEDRQGRLLHQEVGVDEDLLPQEERVGEDLEGQLDPYLQRKRSSSERRSKPL